MLDFELRRWLPRLTHGWLLLSVAQAAAFLTLWPALAHKYWDAARAAAGSDIAFIVAGTFILHCSQVLLGNLVRWRGCSGRWICGGGVVLPPSPAVATHYHHIAATAPAIAAMQCSYR